MIRRSEIHRFAAKLEAEAAEFERISHHPGITGTSQALDRASANILRDVAKQLRMSSRLSRCRLLAHAWGIGDGRR